MLYADFVEKAHKLIFLLGKNPQDESLWLPSVHDWKRAFVKAKINLYVVSKCHLTIESAWYLLFITLEVWNQTLYICFSLYFSFCVRGIKTSALSNFIIEIQPTVFQRHCCNIGVRGITA